MLHLRTVYLIYFLILLISSYLFTCILGKEQDINSSLFFCCLKVLNDSKEKGKKVADNLFEFSSKTHVTEIFWHCKFYTTLSPLSREISNLQQRGWYASFKANSVKRKILSNFSKFEIIKISLILVIVSSEIWIQEKNQGIPWGN